LKPRTRDGVRFAADETTRERWRCESCSRQAVSESSPSVSCLAPLRCHGFGLVNDPLGRYAQQFGQGQVLETLMTSIRNEGNRELSTTPYRPDLEGERFDPALARQYPVEIECKKASIHVRLRAPCTTSFVNSFFTCGRKSLALPSL